MYKDYPEFRYTSERRQTYLPPDIDLRSLKLRFKDVYQLPRVKGDLLFVPFADGHIECHSLSTSTLLWSNTTFSNGVKPQDIIDDMQMIVNDDELLVGLKRVIYVLDINSGNCKFSIDQFNDALDKVAVYDDKLFSQCKEGDSYFMKARSLKSGETIWRSSEPIEFGTSALVMSSDSIVIRGDAGRMLYCYDKLTGKQNWVFAAKTLSSNNTHLGIPCIPLVIGNRLLFSVSNGLAVCMDITTGAILWKVTIPENDVPDHFCFDLNETLYLCGGGVIHCIDLNSGEIKKALGKGLLKKQIYTYPLFDTAVVTQNQLILFSIDLKPLVAINRKKGTVEQSMEIKKIAHPTPFIAADRLFVLDQKGNLYISA